MKNIYAIFNIRYLGRKSTARHQSDSDYNIEETNDCNSHQGVQGEGLAGIQAIMKSLSNINGMQFLRCIVYLS